MIQILLNNKPILLPENNLLSAVLSEHISDGECFAVVLNSRVIPRKEYIGKMLKNGDIVEIILPMQGG